MPERDPANYSLVTYLWVLGVSAMGGFVNFVKRVRDGIARPFNLFELVGELVTSGLAGIITFYLCEYAGFDRALTGAFVGICGHMGSRAFMLFEQGLENWFKKFWGVQ